MSTDLPFGFKKKEGFLYSWISAYWLSCLTTTRWCQIHLLKMLEDVNKGVAMQLFFFYMDVIVNSVM